MECKINWEVKDSSTLQGRGFEGENKTPKHLIRGRETKQFRYCETGKHSQFFESYIFDGIYPLEC